MAPDTPIQFDIISPVSEEQTSQAKSGTQGRSVLESLGLFVNASKLLEKEDN